MLLNSVTLTEPSWVMTMLWHWLCTTHIFLPSFHGTSPNEFPWYLHFFLKSRKAWMPKEGVFPPCIQGDAIVALEDVTAQSHYQYILQTRKTPKHWYEHRNPYFPCNIWIHWLKEFFCWCISSGNLSSLKEDQLTHTVGYNDVNDGLS